MRSIFITSKDFRDGYLCSAMSSVCVSEAPTDVRRESCFVSGDLGIKVFESSFSFEFKLVFKEINKKRRCTDVQSFTISTSYAAHF